MSSMRLHRRQLDAAGALNALLLPLIVVSLLLVAAMGFAAWAASGRQDYKTNVDAKVAAAVSAAIKAEDAKKAAEFAEAAKSPLKTYSGPEAYGSIKVQYPKTWSAYVAEQSTGDANVDGYFYPDVVPAIQTEANSYALRVKVVNRSYASVLQGYQSQVKQKTLTAVPFAFAKVPSVVGTRLDGQIAEKKQGSLVLVPLRANTLMVWTEASQFTNDFNANILPNLSFAP